MAFRLEIPVRWADCDLAKIVYHPQYLHYCHVAMEEIFRQVVGVNYADVVLEQQVGYPAVQVSGEYPSRVPFGETLVVDAVIERLGTKSIDFRYDGRREGDGGLAFTCRTRVVAVDMRSFESIEIPAAHREALESLLVDEATDAR